MEDAHSIQTVPAREGLSQLFVTTAALDIETAPTSPRKQIISDGFVPYHQAKEAERPNKVPSKKETFREEK